MAEATGTHADSLYRLLRALAALGVLREEHGRRFALTPVGELLRSDAEGSLHGWAVFVGRPYVWQAWSAPKDSVRTGENAFRHVYGTSVWEYRAGNPEEAARSSTGRWPPLPAATSARSSTPTTSAASARS